MDGSGRTNTQSRPPHFQKKSKFRKKKYVKICISNRILLHGSLNLRKLVLKQLKE